MARIHRRPQSHIEQLRTKAYDMAGPVRHRMLKAQMSLDEEDLKILRNRRISAFVSAMVEHQANFNVIAILDWMVGQGLNDARYKKYFTETDETWLFEPMEYPQTEETKSAVVSIDTLRRDERYDLHNLPYREYTEDVVDHWLRQHWKYLESRKDQDEEAHTILIDLQSAIDDLPPIEKKVVELVCEGYGLKELTTLHSIPAVHKVYASAKKHICESLRGKNVQDDQ